MSQGAELPPELDHLAEEFVTRGRAGESPSISEYVRRYPEFAEGIREVFPLLAVMEGVKPVSGSATPSRVAALDPKIQVLGDYRLLRIVGRGGMGVVYEAEQKTLGRRVALKVLPPHAMLDPRFVERFRIEAQAAARLQHPHIVPVIGLGEDDGVHYYAMQFIDGHGMDEVLEATRALFDAERSTGQPTSSEPAVRLFTMDLADGSSTVGSASSTGEDVPAQPPAADIPQPSSRAGRRRYHRNVARIGMQAAEALAFAHARGVLHRDVKPSNIMLDERGQAWITDFGLCLQDDSDGLTRTGDLVGTLRYMAPECFRGVYEVRGDVYGLGLTLYELLARAPAFEDTDRATLIRKITQETPPKLRTHDRSIPKDLATIVHKAIAPDPAVRYPTAEALAADLRAFVEGRPIAARAPSLTYVFRAAVRRNRPLAAALLGTALLLIAGTAFYVLSVKEQEAEARLGHYAGNIAAAETALRDGDIPRARLLLEDAPAEFRAWEWRHLASRLDRSVRSFASLAPDIARAAAHSPDGRWLAVGGSRYVCIYAQESGERRIAVPVAGNSTLDLVWSPDSTRLAVGGTEALVVLSGPEGKELLRRPWADYIQGVRFGLAGKRLFVGSEDCLVHVLDAESYEEITTVSIPSKVLSLDIDAQGRRLAVGRLDGRLSMLAAEDLSVLWTEQVSPRALLGVTFIGNDLVAGTAYDGALRVLRAHDGQLVRVLPHEGDLWDVAGSHDGRLLATLERGGRLNLWDPHTGRRFEPRRHGREVANVSFRPDSLGVVTTSWSGTVTEWEFFARQDAHVLGGHLDGVLSLAMHPDGRLAATGGVGGIVRLFDLDTGELVRTWPGHVGWVDAMKFSPDGRFLASTGNAAVSTIQIRRTEDGGVVRRLRGHMRAIADVAYTPDGRKLFSAGYDGTLRVWDPQTGACRQRRQLSPNRLFAMALSPDGRLVAAAGHDRKILLIDAETLRVRTTLIGHTDEVRGLAFHPNGRVLASVSADQTVRLWDAEAGKALRILSKPDSELGPHTDVIQCVVFHPDGTRLVTGSRGAGVSVWDWQRGLHLSTLRGHRGWVHEMGFSPDGERLLSCGSGRVARVWGVRSAAEQAPALREARRRRDLARPVVDALYAQSGDLDQVIETLETRAGLAPDEREAALRVAHARRSTRPELKRWLWRVFTPAEGDAHLRALARTTAHGFARASDYRGLPDVEGYLLTGIADSRVGEQEARYHLHRAYAMAVDRPDLQATALAFLVMSYAAEGRRKEAQESMTKLDALLAERPEARTARVEKFRAEVRAKLESGR